MTKEFLPYLINIIIIAFFFANCIVYRFTSNTLKEASKELNTSERRANKRIVPQKPETIQEIQDHEDSIKNSVDNLNGFYAFFTNIVTIFPLLGMLGTVVSLYILASNTSDLNSQIEINSFFGALSSTILGIIAAILGKIGDAVLSPKVAAVNNEYILLLERNTRFEEEKR